MSETPNTYQERLLPTYRWDRKHKLSSSESELLSYTEKSLLKFRESMESDGNSLLPPQTVVRPIISMNVRKRTSATRHAEEAIARGEMIAPLTSLIPTFMASGHPIPGVEDSYMKDDHPSQELFAYNRLGKKSWVNRRFGEHCLRAIGFAHPEGTVRASSSASTRIKAHSVVQAGVASNGQHFPDEWVIISSKTPIATVEENGRIATLISRVTGAVDLTNPLLAQQETEALVDLSGHEVVHEHQTAAVLAQKALLVDALLRTDDTEGNPFHPVIQTVYLTQQRPTTSR